jgi:hypothetical protein
VLDSYSRASDPRHAAVLPRGFSFAWSDVDPAAHPDHNLLQLAYGLEHRAMFVRPKGYGALPDPPLSEPVDQVDTGFFSWQSHGILKDNEVRRDYHFMEVFSVASLDDVSGVEPPFTILPVEERGFFGACLGSGHIGEESQTFEIASVPFELAIPLLTGWDLNYGCYSEGDHFVQQIGVWLSDMQYQQPQAGQPGRLKYTVTSILRDADPNRGYDFNHKVDVLGIR